MSIRESANGPKPQKSARRIALPKVMHFEMDYNEPNRRGIGKLIGKRGLANEQECRDWVLETIGDKIMEALFS